eukprot:11197063-Heterocapsa_arctica.AAC.1
MAMGEDRMHGTEPDGRERDRRTEGGSVKSGAAAGHQDDIGQEGAADIRRSSGCTHHRATRTRAL